MRLFSPSRLFTKSLFLSTSRIYCPPKARFLPLIPFPPTNIFVKQYEPGRILGFEGNTKMNICSPFFKYWQEADMMRIHMPVKQGNL